MKLKVNSVQFQKDMKNIIRYSEGFLDGTKAGKVLFFRNLATCCSKCNSIKGDRTPEEAGMKMRHKPFKPGYGYFIRNFSKGMDIWTAYLPE